MRDLDLKNHLDFHNLDKNFIDCVVSKKEPTMMSYIPYFCDNAFEIFQKINLNYFVCTLTLTLMDFLQVFLFVTF